MTTSASLQRASAARQVHPGDTTGRKAAVLNEQAAEHEASRERLIRDLRQGHGFSYLTVPGYGQAVVPTEVIDYLRKELAR